MKFQKPSLLLLAALVSFPQLSETIYTPSLPELTRYFSTTENLMQHSLSVYFIGFAVGVFLFGRLSDRWGRRPSLLLGLVVYSIASLACLASPNIELFLIARFVQAVGGSVGSVVIQTMLRDLYAGEERARIFSKLTAVIAFAPAMGPFIGSGISYAFSPMGNFVLLVGLGVVLLVISSVRIQETARVKTSVLMRPLLARMIRDSHIWLCAFFIAAHNGILFSFHAEAPFVLIEMLKMNPTLYGVVGLMAGGSVFVGSMINTRLLKHYSPYALNTVGALVMCMASASLVICIPAIASLQASTASACFLVHVGIIIVGMGISLPNCLSIALKDYRDALGTAGAFLGLLYYLMIGGLLAIMSTIHNGTLWPMPSLFLVLSSLIVLGSLVLSVRSKIAIAT